MSQIMDLKDINVLELLPQRLPFIMIDELTHLDSASAKTMFKVREDNLFCKNGAMEESGLIENIAQTCSAMIGLKNRMENNPSEINDNFVSGQQNNPVSDNIKIGVIVIVYSLEMKRRPLVGENLETSLTIEEAFPPATVVQSEVRIVDEIIAACRMKLLLTDKMPD